MRPAAAAAVALGLLGPVEVRQQEGWVRGMVIVTCCALRRSASEGPVAACCCCCCWCASLAAECCLEKAVSGQAEAAKGRRRVVLKWRVRCLLEGFNNGTNTVLACWHAEDCCMHAHGDPAAATSHPSTVPFALPSATSHTSIVPCSPPPCQNTV